MCQSLRTAVLIASVSWSGAFGQEPAGASMKSVDIPRLVGEALVIDGRMDEAVWERAAVVEDLHQVDPQEYGLPSEPTRVLVYYDEDALYVAARMPQTLQIVANILRQGQEFWGDDFFTLIIDTFNDKRNGYRFQVNPNGVRMEAIYENTTSINWNWNGIWRAASTESRRRLDRGNGHPLQDALLQPGQRHLGDQLHTRHQS